VIAANHAAHRSGTQKLSPARACGGAGGVQLALLLPFRLVLLVHAGASVLRAGEHAA
jgi:hypothetical protein